MTDRLNPEALEDAANSVRRTTLGEVDSWDVAKAAVSAYLAALPAPPTITTVEGLEALPVGSVIMATGGQRHPESPELFLKAGYHSSPWLALDPSDRDDGEVTEHSGTILKWRCHGEARVLHVPTEGGGDAT